MEENLTRFKEIVKENFSRKDFPYRDWLIEYHLAIVEKIAMELCDIYTTANRDLVKALVWFHDFGKPIDQKNEREVTVVEGPRAMKKCGFPDEFIDTVTEYWKLMEQKNEIDIRTTPIEVQIVSSADGASHFTGVFHASYFGDGDSFIQTQEHLRIKIEKDWNRKIVLPEVQKAFLSRYERARELLGEFPKKFL